jgi:hypothetical protein
MRKIKGAFIPHRRAMLESPAWRALPEQGRKVLDRIEIEYLRRSGTENGHVVVTYANFTDYTDLYPRDIACGIKAAEVLGFLRIGRGCGGNADFKAPNTYTLTYMSIREQEPTDDWQKIHSLDDAKEKLAAVRKSRGISRWLSQKLQRAGPGIH